MTEHRGIIELSEMHCFTAGYRTIHLRFLLLLRRRSSSTRTELITTVFFFLFPHKKKNKNQRTKILCCFVFFGKSKSFFWGLRSGEYGRKMRERSCDRQKHQKKILFWLMLWWSCTNKTSETFHGCHFYFILLFYKYIKTNQQIGKFIKLRDFYKIHWKDYWLQ